MSSSGSMAKKGAKMRPLAGDRQNFGEKICDVPVSRHKDDAEVSLPYTVPQPIEAHVKRLRYLEIDGVGCESDGDFIVAK